MFLVGGKNAILHSLDRGEHRHERRTQLVGNIARQAMLKLKIALESRRHVVEGLAQLTNLVIADDSRAGGQVTGANLGSRRRNRLHGLGELARYKDAHEAGENHGDNTRRDDGLIGVGAEGGVTLGEQGVRPEGPKTDRADHGTVLELYLAHNNRLGVRGCERNGIAARGRGNGGSLFLDRDSSVSGSVRCYRRLVTTARPGIVIYNFAISIEDLHADFA